MFSTEVILVAWDSEHSWGVLDSRQRASGRTRLLRGTVSDRRTPASPFLPATDKREGLFYRTNKHNKLGYFLFTQAKLKRLKSGESLALTSKIRKICRQHVCKRPSERWSGCIDWTYFNSWTRTYVCLDIPPDLLAEGEVFGQGTLDYHIVGLDVRWQSCRTKKTKPTAVSKCSVRLLFNLINISNDCWFLLA